MTHRQGHKDTIFHSMPIGGGDPRKDASNDLASSVDRLLKIVTHTGAIRLGQQF